MNRFITEGQRVISVDDGGCEGGWVNSGCISVDRRAVVAVASCVCMEEC